MKKKIHNAHTTSEFEGCFWYHSHSIIRVSDRTNGNAENNAYYSATKKCEKSKKREDTSNALVIVTKFKQVSN